MILMQYIRRRKVVFADNKNKCIVGDVVLIKSCPPISKKKHYTIHEVVAHAPRYTPLPTTEESTSSPAEEGDCVSATGGGNESGDTAPSSSSSERTSSSSNGEVRTSQ